MRWRKIMIFIPFLLFFDLFYRQSRYWFANRVILEVWITFWNLKYKDRCTVSISYDISELSTHPIRRINISISFDLLSNQIFNLFLLFHLFLLDFLQHLHSIIFSLRPLQIQINQLLVFIRLMTNNTRPLLWLNFFQSLSWDDMSTWPKGYKFIEPIIL